MADLIADPFFGMSRHLVEARAPPSLGRCACSSTTCWSATASSSTAAESPGRRDGASAK